MGSKQIRISDKLAEKINTVKKELEDAANQDFTTSEVLSMLLGVNGGHNVYVIGSSRNKKKRGMNQLSLGGIF